MSEVVSLWEHLISCLINMQLSSCVRESVGSGKVTKGKLSCLMMKANLNYMSVADGVIFHHSSTGST